MNRTECPSCGGTKKPSARQCRDCYQARGYKECSYPDCTNWALTHGLCNTHRLRMKRNGTLEHLCPCGAQATNLAGRPRCDACRVAGKVRTQRSADLKRMYGMTMTSYYDLLASQGGGCAICGVTDPGRRHVSFSVDHSHEDSRVRGLLCHSCNVGIGHLGDDPARLRVAALYLEARP